MKKILVVDHEPFSRTVLQDILGGEYQVFAAATGAEAMALARRQTPDLILLDLDTPEDDRAALCTRLKETQTTRYIPLILLSSCSQKQEILDGFYAGADDYLTKPLCASETLARIDAHLRTRDDFADLEKEDLLMLLELSEIISVTRNPKRILAIIVEKVAAALKVSRCSVIALNDTGELMVKASSDLPPNLEIKIDLEKYPEIEKAWRTQRPVVLQDIHRDPLMAPVRMRLQGLPDQAILVVPIIKKQNVIGTFFLRTAAIGSGGISGRVFTLCQLVANISGNALENGIVFEAMQSKKKLLEELAFRDSLTGLYNHQHFHTRFEEEFSRAQRYALPLSCVFADIDGFKTINDRFGHITGDVVLKQIGRRIERMLRKSDLAARYGGEEFAVLLPNTTEQGARDFADRLRTEIGALAIQQLKGERVSISVGAATWQDGNTTTYTQLLHLADNAMYVEKQAKKGQGR
ncbi:diguanylate cyclase [Desulfuromonas sp. CSMB_57]|uniref:GGDEF domain-containing response regulator n=1 Tax=Desulfuromonas sp. CSMB_57 TaxID=2807629 RepID=UPI001CD70125|nr:diguanylate cyclase [Desulfuromonas sp. CSMB_57]